MGELSLTADIRTVICMSTVFLFDVLIISDAKCVESHVINP